MPAADGDDTLELESRPVADHAIASSLAAASHRDVADERAVAPPASFRFPWPRAEVEAPAPAPIAAAQPSGIDFFPPPAPPEADERFASVDDALPAAEPDEIIADAAPPKRGFFARLFGRGARAVDADEALEVEVHEDRIEAAAQALDQVGVEQFESFEGPAGDDASIDQPKFESVDEALPQAIPALDGLPLLEPMGETTDEFEIASLEGPTDPMPDERSVETDRKHFWTSTFARLFRRSETHVEPIDAEAEEAARASSTFLLAKFRAFYNEIIKFRHQKSEFSAGFATAILTDYSADLSPDAAAEGLSKRFSELLELQAAEAKWMGGEASERYPEAQYAMAALADELFTYHEWEGQVAWPKFLLERKLHQSHDADIELFRRIDRLLKESPDSAVSRDLARVYLLVLAAGFRGKWRPFELTRPVAEYRRRLYEYIYGSDPLMLYSADRRVFPDAAARTLAGHAVSRFTAAQRWAAILVFLLVSYTVVAHIAWSRASADLRDVTSRIGAGGDGRAGAR